MSEFPAAQPLYDERSLNLSEKEVLDLFEKMMVSWTPNLAVMGKRTCPEEHWLFGRRVWVNWVYVTEWGD